MKDSTRNLLFGIIGGAVGTAVIGKAMSVLSKLDREENVKREQELIQEPPPQKLAETVASKAIGVELSGEQKAAAGEAVRWGYGIFWGAMYGVLRKNAPFLSWGGGFPFGFALSALGPGLLLPALGLTPKPTQFPMTAHIRGLLSHYAYAATVDGVCRIGDKLSDRVSIEKPQARIELRRAG